MVKTDNKNFTEVVATTTTVVEPSQLTVSDTIHRLHGIWSDVNFDFLCGKSGHFPYVPEGKMNDRLYQGVLTLCNLAKTTNLTEKVISNIKIDTPSDSDGLTGMATEAAWYNELERMLALLHIITDTIYSPTERDLYGDPTASMIAAMISAVITYLIDRQYDFTQHKEENNSLKEFTSIWVGYKSTRKKFYEYM